MVVSAFWVFHFFFQCQKPCYFVALVVHPSFLKRRNLITPMDLSGTDSGSGDREILAKRKLLVLQLDLETTSEELGGSFDSFGELEKAVIIKGRNRDGIFELFGFVTFKTVEGAELALQNPPKQIRGKEVVTQNVFAGCVCKKIYVDIVPSWKFSRRGSLVCYFSRFGEIEQWGELRRTEMHILDIEEWPLNIQDGDTKEGPSRMQDGEIKGIFIVYKTEEEARASLVHAIKHAVGCQLSCRFAIDDEKLVEKIQSIFGNLEQKTIGEVGEQQTSSEVGNQQTRERAPRLSTYRGDSSGYRQQAQQYRMPYVGLTGAPGLRMPYVGLTSAPGLSPYGVPSGYAQQFASFQPQTMELAAQVQHHYVPALPPQHTWGVAYLPALPPLHTRGTGAYLPARQQQQRRHSHEQN